MTRPNTRFLLLFTLIMIIAACSSRTQEDRISKAPPETSQSTAVKDTSNYIPQSSDDTLAAAIREWLTNDYLEEDLEIMDEYSRQFQYFSTDLNGDGSDEIMIKFTGPWFCGSGGCTFLLTDQDLNVITQFTVMDPPVWAEKNPEGDWKLLLVRNGGELKELRYENGSYPSNPSVVEKAPYDAASGHAIIMFDETFAPAKTYRF